MIIFLACMDGLSTMLALFGYSVDLNYLGTCVCDEDIQVSFLRSSRNSKCPCGSGAVPQSDDISAA